MDPLSDVLRAARLTGGVFFKAEFSAPWCLAGRLTPELCAPLLGATGHLVPYHYVSEGELAIGLAGEPPRTLHAGDVVLFPRNDFHLMGSDLGLPAISAADVLQSLDRRRLQTIRHGGGGAVTRLVCGYLGCDSAYGNPILSTLPSSMTLAVDGTPAADWIRSTFQFAADEAADATTGSDTVLTRLSELLFIEAVRLHVRDMPEDQTGWLAGLRDPAVSRALALMHGDIVRPWSVEELGRAAGISRSALAERFGRVIGMAPIGYLIEWRLQVAAQKLKETPASLAQVAAAVGYESEAAFSRAFKNRFGSAPATWRRAAR